MTLTNFKRKLTPLSLVISTLSLSILAHASGNNTFLTSDRWPCSQNGCSEVCKYSGFIDNDKKETLNIETRFSLQDNVVVLRVLSQFDANHSLVGNVEGWSDETNYFDATTGQQIKYDNNTRIIMGGRDGQEANNISWQGWYRMHFNWSQRQVEGYLIQGKDQNEMQQKFPLFTQYWDLSKFAANWQEDFEAASPYRDTRYDIKEFGETAATPGYMSFYLPRFLKDKELSSTELIVGKENTTENPGNEGKPYITKITSQVINSQIVWQTILRVGEIYTPSKEPNKIYVDPNTKQIKSIEANLTHPWVLGTYRARLMNEGCTISQ